ncbi:transposase [Streptomyces sp. NPDC048680]|uniref:transposase n=1 Tax=Streptomyces sp. NPDC048680 TaxID=3155492 RepID=UPI003437B754
MLYAVGGQDLNSSVVSCDCLAHRFGNAADQPGRAPVYSTDLTDVEWREIRPLLPVPGWLEGRGGRPEGYCHRQMLDAVFYVLDNGIKWRAIPVDFPAWDRVYAFFRRRREAGLLLMMINVTAGNDTDRQAATDMLPALRDRFLTITGLWADGGYTGTLITGALATLYLAVTVIKRSDDVSGFVVLPRRWVVERTFGRLMRSRRLARDYERRPGTSEAMILWSMTILMTRRLAARAPV